MNMQIKVVDASHGWRWIAAGMLIFRKNPPLWLLLITFLFLGSRVLFAIPLIGVIAVLIAPNLLAGLAHGAQALEQGKPLRLAYLASGFLKNAAQLITIGGVSLVGQFLTLMAIVLVGGEPVIGIFKTMAAGAAATAEMNETVRAAAPRLVMAMIVGIGVSLPLMMAVWFAPLLVFFDDVKPLPALALSLWACLKNILPLLIFGMVVLAPLVIMTPLSFAARQPDLGLWLLAPILVPSIYASYKDLFGPTPAPD